MLKIKEVSKNFGGISALKKVSLEVEKGKVMGIIGPNGAGKTTLFNIISSFIKPDHGEVILDGDRIDRLSPNKVARKGVGRTFQVTKVFHNFSVMDNLRVRCSERKEIMEAIEFVQLNDLLDRIAGELSLFEQKRLEMTMALALRPKLLLLDELTSGLSLMEKKYFQNLIGKIKMDFKPAIVLIEHDVKIALEISDQIAVLYYGTVLASGKPSEVIHDEKVIKNYLGRKAV